MAFEVATLPKILCVDDGQSFQTVRHILEQAGCDVILAESVQQALAVLNHTVLDGVVLAYQQGNTESLSLRNRIHHVEPDLPVLLLSEHGTANRASLHMLALYIREHSLSNELVGSN